MQIKAEDHEIIQQKLNKIKCSTGCLNSINYLVFGYGIILITQGYTAQDVYQPFLTFLKKISSILQISHRLLPIYPDSMQTRPKEKLVKSISLKGKSSHQRVKSINSEIIYRMISRPSSPRQTTFQNSYIKNV